MEKWKPIPGWIDLYEVSDMGRVRRLGRSDLTPQLRPDGYIQVRLSHRPSNRRVLCLVHRLVLLAFVGPSELGINHRDGRKENNHLANLEYASTSENVKHAYKNNLRSSSKGRPRVYVLDEEKKRELHRLLDSGVPKKTIARRLGISRALVYYYGNA